MNRKLSTHVKRTANRLDQAINLGLAAAYPTIFGLPCPDPPPDWKDGVRFGWRIVKATTRETIRILKKGLP